MNLVKGIASQIHSGVFYLGKLEKPNSAKNIPDEWFILLDVLG